jgi:hypothetical protein
METNYQAATDSDIALPPDYNTIEYAPIELLERGDVDIWLRRRGAILEEKSKETALECEASKLVSLGACLGAAVMSSNPLAWIALVIAGGGYIYTIFQERQDIGSIRPIPLYRGKLGNILKFMEGEEVESPSTFIDQIAYLSDAEKAEIVLIRGRFAELSRLLTLAPAKVRFDLYRYTCEQFYLRQDLITGEEVKCYVATAVSEARRTAMPSAPQSVLGEEEVTAIAPATDVVEAQVEKPVSSEDTWTVGSQVPTVEQFPVPVVQPREQQLPTPSDIALEMALIPKSTIIAASPRVGKGIVVSMAIAHIRQLQKDLEIWLIDPKDEPTERHYWSQIDLDKRCHFDLRPFDVDVEEAIEVFTEHLTRFNSSLSYRKLLIIDEFVTLNQKCAGSFMNRLKDFIVGICSSGEVNPDLGLGRFAWVITQSPYVSDIGFKTKAALVTFQRVFILNKASIHLYPLAVSASFVPAGFEDKIARLMKATGRVFYYSRTDSWHPVPNYKLTNSTTDSQLRAKLEGLVKGGEDTPETVSESPETAERTETPAETMKSMPNGHFSQREEVSAKRFTKLKLPFIEAKELVLRLRSEMSQTKIIEVLWSAKPGESKAYKEALSEYKELIGDEGK